MSTHHTLRIRRAACAPLALAAWAALTTPSAFAFAMTTYPGDPGMLGDASSWRTPEFLRDWGLQSVGAEFAYAAGYSGLGIRVGMVDSGYFDQHPELPALRYTGVAVNGIAGAYNPAFNDSHGTHVGGTMAAARDGGAVTTNFHGVAFNARLYVGNTGKTDGVLFGIPQATQTAAQTLDQAHVADVYRAVNAQGVRIIGSSWGSQPNTEQYQTLFPTTGTNVTGRAGLMGAWEFLQRPGTWMAGALDAAASGTAVLFSAGNTGYANASARSAAAYFRPELEGTWLAVSAIRQVLTVGGINVGQTLNPDGSVDVPGAQLYNRCGVAKWSCVTAPGNAINGSTVSVVGGVPTAAYGSLSGTSMAQPHAAGVLAVIMQRFAYLSNEQAVAVMKTTALQNGTISDAAGVAIANPTRGQLVAVPDDRNGWGTVSLRHAMNGPGQFIGAFAVNTQGFNDTWSNSISDTAARARRAEDQAEAITWTATKVAKGWTNGLPPGSNADDINEYTVGTARESARSTRVYAGSLAKHGNGSLALTGLNSYTGGTQVFGGTLLGRSASAFGSGDVRVYGGTLAGSSTITGSLFNEGGTVSPGVGVGTLTVLGDFAQLGGGTLDFEIDDGAADLLQVAGSALFGGTLGVTFVDGFAGLGLFTLLSVGSYSGLFSAFSVVGLSGGYGADLVYTAAGLQLSVTAVPEPQTWVLMLAGVGVMGWMCRRRGGSRPKRLSPRGPVCATP